MFTVDGEKIVVRCKPDIYIAIRSCDIYIRGADLFDTFLDRLDRLFIYLKMYMYRYDIELLREAVEKNRKLFSMFIMYVRNICDVIVKAKKMEIAGRVIYWDSIFENLEEKVDRYNDYIKALEMLCDMCVSKSYRGVILGYYLSSGKFNMDKICKDICYALKYIVEWSMYITGVIVNSIIYLSNKLYSIAYEVVDMYYEGKISEKSMSYTVADIDERLAMLSKMMDDISENRWIFRTRLPMVYKVECVLREYIKNVIGI